MGRKVLISFLGTGNYVPVFYTWTDKKSIGKQCTKHKTKFVQEAIATKLCGSWTEKDCIMVFRTEQSNAKNWLDTKVEKPDGSGEETVQGLASTLKNIKLNNGNKLKCRINPEPEDKEDTDSYIIPTGLDYNTQAEMEEIFNQVFGKLDIDDEIYFDVTHAFRTIPLFATVLFNYARFLKGTSLNGIYYGAYEKLDKNTQKAPIANLIDIVRLQEINNAAASFRKFGNLRAFSELLLGDEDSDDNIKNISNALARLDRYMQICQLDKIKDGEYITEIESNVNGFRESIYTQEAQCTLLDTIIDHLKNDFSFKGYPTYANIEAAIDWALEYNMIQQALTMAQEYIVTITYDRLVEDEVLSEFKESIKDEKKKDVSRYDVRNKLGYIIASYNPFQGKYDSNPQRFKGLTDVYTDLFCSDMGRLYVEIRDLRNSINHANTTRTKPDDDRRNKDSFDFNQDIEVIKEYIQNIWEECKLITKVYVQADQPH